MGLAARKLDLAVDNVPALELVRSPFPNNENGAAPVRAVVSIFCMMMLWPIMVIVLVGTIVTFSWVSVLIGNYLGVLLG